MATTKRNMRQQSPGARGAMHETKLIPEDPRRSGGKRRCIRQSNREWRDARQHEKLWRCAASAIEKRRDMARTAKEVGCRPGTTTERRVGWRAVLFGENGETARGQTLPVMLLGGGVSRCESRFVSRSDGWLVSHQADGRLESQCA